MALGERIKGKCLKQNINFIAEAIPASALIEKKIHLLYSKIGGFFFLLFVFYKIHEIKVRLRAPCRSIPLVLA